MHSCTVRSRSATISGEQDGSSHGQPVLRAFGADDAGRIRLDIVHAGWGCRQAYATQRLGLADRLSTLRRLAPENNAPATLPRPTAVWGVAPRRGLAGGSWITRGLSSPTAV